MLDKSIYFLLRFLFLQENEKRCVRLHNYKSVFYSKYPIYRCSVQQTTKNYDFKQLFEGKWSYF